MHIALVRRCSGVGDFVWLFDGFYRIVTMSYIASLMHLALSGLVVLMNCSLSLKYHALSGLYMHFFWGDWLHHIGRVSRPFRALHRSDELYRIVNASRPFRVLPRRIDGLCRIFNVFRPFRALHGIFGRWASPHR